jgi:hypothetical protein
MKLNKIKIFALLGVGLISALTFVPTLNTQAALSAPTSWDYKYTNEDSPGYKIRTSTSVLNTPEYTRTGTSGDYNYTMTQLIQTDLSITKTFYRSNTSWGSSGSNYIPSDAIGFIGGSGTVNTAWDIILYNDTFNDWLFYIDVSSTGGEFGATLSQDNNVNPVIIYSASSITNNRFIVYSKSSVKIGTQFTGGTRKFDAWYLKDLGRSDAFNVGYEYGNNDGYNEGFEDGYGNSPNLLITGFQAMVGILVNFALMIFNLEVFGVSLLNIFGILALFVGLIWILKIVRG